LNNQSILVTGSSGFIGTNLLDELLPKNKILGINNTTDKKKQNYTSLKKDITKLQYREISKEITGIIHLAALTDTQYCEQNPEKCFQTNVLGTLRILEIGRKKDCKIVYVSTNHVYGKPIKLPIRENHPKNPQSAYASSKLVGEYLCEVYSKNYNMDISIVRLFSVYGPNSPRHLVTTRIFEQLGKKSITLGNLNAKRDFVYIKDAIRAITTVYKKNHGFNSYNVGSGKSYSIRNLCDFIKKISGYNPQIRSVSSMIRKNEIKNVVANTSKIQKLGWKNETDILQGLQLTYNWFKNRSKI